MNQNHKYEPVSLIWLIVIAIFMVAFVWKVSEAQYREIEQETKVNTGDVNIAGDSSRAYGFSHSLGDVDINECIVSHQKVSFIVSWQGYDYNAWCMGEVYDRKGLTKMAALMRCDIAVIRQHFTSDKLCQEANTISFEVTGSPEIDALKDRVARYDEGEEERHEQFEELTEQLQVQQEQIEYLTHKPATIVQREVVQEPLLSKELAEQLRYAK